MKQFFALLLVLVYLASGDASCSSWSDRMSKYADLVRCELYATESKRFKHYFSLDNLHVRASIDYLYSFTFSSLADKTIRFQLSEGNETATATTQFPVLDYTPEEEEWETSTYSAYPEDRDPPPRYEQQFFTKYEIVLGSIVEDSVWQNNRYYVKEFVESYISVEGKRLKTLTTPNIIRTNEPNEVRVDMFRDGRIRITVNDVTTMETRIPKINDLKYYSFAALKNREREEYYHNCKFNFGSA